MTAARDMSRPATQHRLSVSSNASSLPARSAYSRSHSHAVSVGGPGRISRRKSSTFSPVTNPAVIGAVVEHAVAGGTLEVKRRSSISKAALASLNDGTPSALPALPTLPHHASVPESSALTAGLSGSALVDGPSLAAFNTIGKVNPKFRRSSDGTHLTKKEKAAAGELKCEHCGKAYKHGSCLTKHLWEHTPQWQYTSKLLISKHQQVQLLEAASVLVAMNTEHSGDSDNSSSPAASGSSDMRHGTSSTESTPPPHATDREDKRLSNNSSAYSRSFQSVFSSDSMSHSEPGFAHHNHHHHQHHHRQWSMSSNYRPATGHTSIADSYRDEDPQDLAAAVGLLSCSYGTPKSGPTAMPADIPPVPPLPAKYQAQSFSDFRRGQEHDITMDDDDDDDDDEHGSSDDERPARHDDDYGMFGKMD